MQAENGHVDIAIELFEFMSRFRIPGAQRQIFDSIMRKTWGWKKKEDRISNSQLMALTNMSKANVSRALKSLIQHRLVNTQDNKLSINKNYSDWKPYFYNNTVRFVNTQDNSVLTPRITLVNTQDNKLLTPRMDTKDTTKDTKQKKEELTTTFLERFNQIRGTKYKTSITWAENFSYWNKSYSLEEMIRAVKMAQYDPWMNEVISPELLFRTRNKNGSCDYIGKLLNLKVAETEEDILLKTALKGT